MSLNNGKDRFSFGRFSHELSHGLATRKRWKGRETPFYRDQSVLHHTIEQLLLLVAVINLEIEEGNQSINPYLLMCMGLTHDLAELHLDDLIYPMKRRRNVKQLYEKLEQEIFLSMCDELPPPLSAGFINAFQEVICGESPNKRLFEATEHLGYMLDALECVEAGGNDDYLEVFIVHGPIVEAFCTEFQGLKQLYEMHKSRFESVLKRMHPDFRARQQLSLTF